MTRRRYNGLADIDFERLAERVAERVWNTALDTTMVVANPTPLTQTVTVTDNTVTGDPNMFRIHDLQQEPYPQIYIDGEPVTTDAYQSRILSLMQKVEVLEVRVAELSQFIVEHIRRSNPPPDRKQKRCVLFDKEKE
jgi:hypothetical protein